MRCEIDFERDPWTRVSEDAKELVRGMLDPNPHSRMTVEEVLGMYVFHLIYGYDYLTKSSGFICNAIKKQPQYTV